MKTIQILTSKSDAHRALIAAGLSEEPCRVIYDNGSKDIEATKQCIGAIRSALSEPDRMVDLRCCESGSTFRFLIPVVAALGIRGAFYPEGRLSQRPLSPMYEELIKQGAQLSAQGSIPFTVEGPLRAGDYYLPGNVSSQFVTGLLFALPMLSGDSRIHLLGERQSMGYIDMTLNTLNRYGIRIEITEEETLLIYRIPGGQKYRRDSDYVAEGDWSNAAFWLVMGVLGDEPVCVTGLSQDSAQGDRKIVDILQEMGAELIVDNDRVTAYPSVGKLHGVTIDASQIPDMIPALSAVASVADGVTRVEHAERLRIKESDRLEAIRVVMTAMGADITETEDGLIITGVQTLHGAEIDSFNDHRIAMMAAAASMKTEGCVTIHGAASVQKSYPTFFTIMNEKEMDNNIQIDILKGEE